MKSKLPDLKLKIEENIKELRYSEDVTELICVLENPLGGQIQVQLKLIKDSEDEYNGDLMEVTYNIPVIKINGGLIV